MMSIRQKIKRAYHQVKYHGDLYQCPICGFEAKLFLDAGLYKRRSNSKCPSCGSLERHRALWIVLDGIIKAARHKLKILHFAPEGCISGPLSSRTELEYLTSNYDKNRVSHYHFDLQNIDCEDDFFDVIICSHVLEHVDDDNLAMREIFRVLKKPGIALIQVPLWPSEAHPTYENRSITDPRDRVIHFGQFDHVRIYGLDVVQRLERAGFQVEVLDMEQRVEPSLSKKYRLHNNLNIRELIFKSVK